MNNKGDYLMTILQICSIYPPSFSGYGKQLNTINKYLLKKHKNIHINILTTFDGNSSDGNLEHISMLKGTGKDYKKQKIIYFLFISWFMIKNITLFFKADIYHVVKAGPETILPVIFAKIFGKKVIVKIAQDDMKPIEGSGTKRILKQIRYSFVAKSDYIVAISESIKNDLLIANVKEEKIISIHNAVDTNRFRPIDQQEKIYQKKKLLNTEDNKDFIFTYVGSICKRKGIVDLIEALKLCNFSKKVIILLIGPDHQEIDNFHISLSELSELKNISISHIDNTPTPEAYLQISDCLILPSYSEGMPNVVLESISCGVPVLLSDIPIHKQLNDDNIGIIFKTGDRNSFSRKLENIVNNNELENRSKEVRSVSLDQYSIEKISQEYYDLYSRLL